jgi:glycosyltransferase involved in cell wall biosynthesis
MSLIIYAPNVHRGGGRVLLLSLLEAAGKHRTVAALLDQRLEITQELSRSMTITRVAPTILGRLAGEWTLGHLVRDTDKVLCFGNLPPLFRIRGRVIVFLQNGYLVQRNSFNGFPLRVKLRLTVERLWLRLRSAHATAIIVQTRSMRQAAEHVLRRTVEIVAFTPGSLDCRRQAGQKTPDRPRRYNFVYVASGEPHKNHLNLIDAWILLASEGLYPSLCLTLPEADCPELITIIGRAKTDHKLNIYNVLARSREEMEALYQNSQALIYPATLESFGLPLIEARQAGLSIIAAELDYVRDLVDPEETFEPSSPLSISRAVKRYLAIPEPPLSLYSPRQFLDAVLRD